MFNKKLVACAVASALLFSTAASADENKTFKFKSLTTSADSTQWNSDKPWKLAKGFTQTVVSNEKNLNIYPQGRDDWHDMNASNETGPMAGRFLYTTHEVRMNEPGSKYYDPVINELGGSISVVDLKTGETKVLLQRGGLDEGFTALDGIRWSPWGTLIFAEETSGGRLFEIILNEDMMSVAEVIDRPDAGRLSHEGIDFDKDGNLYIVDEHRGRSSGCNGVVPCGGGIYKFVPEIYGDLSRGSLYVLKVAGADGLGKAEWVGPIDPLNARESGTYAGGQSYQRPEDIEVIGDTLYVAITEGPRDIATKDGLLSFQKELYQGRVIAIDLKEMTAKNFVKPGMNVPVEIGKPGEAGFQTGFDGVDNLAEAPNGDLVMIEDNKPSDIWFASKKVNKLGASKEVKLFASLTDPGAEGTGIYFSPADPNTLYVNVQHSAAEDGDATWAITRENDD